MNFDLLPDKIKIRKTPKKSILNKLPEPLIYSPASYGITNMCTGKGVKIALLDSGCPQHKDIKIEGDKISFCDENINTGDKNGHATAVAGVINANNRKSLVGFAPHANILFGKIMDASGVCNFNSLVAGVLWGVVKRVDIIVVALGASCDYMVLHDAIKKAREHGICVFAASGDKGVGPEWEIEFPARYDEVFSAGCLKRTKAQNEIIKERVDFSIPNRGLYTTYLNNKYIKMSGSSMSTAFFAGLAAVLVEQYKKEGKKDIPSYVYSALLKVFK